MLTLHAHLVYLKAFDAELNAVTRGKPAQIRNHIIWSTMLHSRDAFVIHFSSWAKHSLDDGDGLFSVLRNSCPTLLVRRLPRKFDPHVGDFGDVQFRIVHRQVFEKLFPLVVGRHPENVRLSDIEPLEHKFRAETAAVRDDRDANRAHPYANHKRP